MQEQISIGLFTFKRRWRECSVCFEESADPTASFRTVSLTVKEIKAFINCVKPGDRIPTIVGLRKWTSSTNFAWVPVRKTVTILHKYPELVETDVGIMQWKELIIGYCGGNLYGSALWKVVEEGFPESLAA